MSFKELKYEVQDNIGVITLNRPEAMNSLSYTLYMELEDAVRNSTAYALIITGEGRAFCAGDDVKQILGGGTAPPAESIERGKKPAGSHPQRMRCCTATFPSSRRSTDRPLVGEWNSR